MDYEIKLKQMAEELRHEVEMRKLQASHLDTHDASFAQVREILAATAEQLHQLSLAQAVTETKPRFSTAFLVTYLSVVWRAGVQSFRS
jgi:hypothetical protein